MKEKTILVFSAELQKETPHTVDVDGAGEVVLTCTETGRAIKFPAGTDAKALKGLVASHKEANKGQISKVALDKKREELLANL